MSADTVGIDAIPNRPPMDPVRLATRPTEWMALPVYHSEATADERDRAVTILRGQLADIMGVPAHAVLGVDCPDCGRRIALVFAYRCAYCGVWRCHVCSQIHFGKRAPGTAE